MFSNILVPLDGSELAENALEKSKELALNSGATIHLVHVVSRRPEFEAGFPGGMGSIALAEFEVEQSQRLVQSQIDRGIAYLDQVTERLESAGIKIASNVLEGAADEQIAEYAENHDVDLIVISSRGHGGIKRLVLGSVTDYLVRSGVAPVLVWPAK